MYIYITINFTCPNKPIYANISGTGPSTCPIPASPPDAGRDDSMASLVLCKKLAPLCWKCSDSKSCDFPSVNVLSFPMLKKGPYPIGIFFFWSYFQNRSWKHWFLDSLAHIVPPCPNSHLQTNPIGDRGFCFLGVFFKHVWCMSDRIIYCRLTLAGFLQKHVFIWHWKLGREICFRPHLWQNLQPSAPCWVYDMNKYIYIMEPVHIPTTQPDLAIMKIDAYKS